MSRRIPIVAIVGRTNVGKSTLFNAIAQRRIAVVEDTPGVTRDRNYELIERYGFPFTIVDTGGLIGEEENPLHDAVRVQAEVAIEEADLIIALFDGKHGPHPFDEEVVSRIRRSGRPVIWVANKTEKKAWADQAQEFYSLGLDEVVLVSAANGRGIDDLVERIRVRLDLPLAEEGEEQRAEDPKEKAIRIAIVGRPNVGKSTLVNKLLGEDRVVASPLPGTTRDSVDVKLHREGRSYVLIDTAGLRRRSHVDKESVERFANIRALSALATCDVAVLVIDAEAGIPTDQDIRIGTLIHERGRSFIIAVNKWDKIEKDSKTAKAYEEMVYSSFNFARYAPVIFISGLTGKRCPTLLDKVSEIAASAHATVDQEQLEQVVYEAFRRNNPPTYHGQPIKCFGVEQIRTNPPTFSILVNNPRGLNAPYERYIKGALREAFPFPGIDIRIFFDKKTRSAAKREAEERAADPYDTSALSRWTDEGWDSL